MTKNPPKIAQKISYKAQISCKNLDCFFGKKEPAVVREEATLVEEAK